MASSGWCIRMGAGNRSGTLVEHAAQASKEEEEELTRRSRRRRRRESEDGRAQSEMLAAGDMGRRRTEKTRWIGPSGMWNGRCRKYKNTRCLRHIHTRTYTMAIQHALASRCSRCSTPWARSCECSSNPPLSSIPWSVPPSLLIASWWPTLMVKRESERDDRPG